MELNGDGTSPSTRKLRGVHRTWDVLMLGRMLTLPTSALLRTLSATASGCFLAGDAMARPLTPVLDIKDLIVEYYCVVKVLNMEGLCGRGRGSRLEG